MISTKPSMRGESWLGVEITCKESPDLTSHAQPEPKRVKAALVKASLKFSKEPNVEEMASLNAPVGNPPPDGEIPSQKKV